MSNKSGANVYRGNVFFESRGALVLRHGDGNLVEDNVFLGNGEPHTGGIRVINRRQTVRNNYMEGLSGNGFASALTIMYGVPNSPLNRYVQMEDAALTHNTIINARSIFIGAGKDDERSARPIKSRLTNTLIVNRDGRDPLRVEGDISGIELSDNVQSADRAERRSGVRMEHVALVRNGHGLLVPEQLSGVGARRDLQMIARGNTEVAWYPKDRVSVGLDEGRSIDVRNGEDVSKSASFATILQPCSAALSLVCAPMGLRKLFVEHPASVGETYLEHFGNASRFAMHMIGGGGACLIHSVLPFLFANTTSRIIAELHQHMVVDRRAVE